MTKAKAPDVESLMMWAVQALAQPWNAQLKLFPPYVVVADELVLVHDEVQSLFLAASRPTPDQARTLARLDEHTQVMSDMNRPDLWTIAGLRDSAEWATCRSLARDALLAMGWPVAPPHTERGGVYVGPPDAPTGDLRPRFYWGEAVRIRSEAPEPLRPGDDTEVCGICEVKTDRHAESLGCVVGSIAYSVGFLGRPLHRGPGRFAGARKLLDSEVEEGGGWISTKSVGLRSAAATRRQ